MQMDLTTPGLLFPAISLLLLAYTNRFVVLANVIRQLSVFSFVLCTISMFALFIAWTQLGELLFGISLVLLVLSLLFSLYEVQISTQAINIELERLDR